MFVGPPARPCRTSGLRCCRRRHPRIAGGSLGGANDAGDPPSHCGRTLSPRRLAAGAPARILPAQIGGRMEIQRQGGGGHRWRERHRRRAGAALRARRRAGRRGRRRQPRARARRGARHRRPGDRGALRREPRRRTSRRWSRSARERFGRVDAYISNAGILGRMGGIELEDALWEKHVGDPRHGARLGRARGGAGDGGARRGLLPRHRFGGRPAEHRRDARPMA